MRHPIHRWLEMKDEVTITKFKIKSMTPAPHILIGTVTPHHSPASPPSSFPVNSGSIGSVKPDNHDQYHAPQGSCCFHHFSQSWSLAFGNGSIQGPDHPPTSCPWEEG